MKTDVLRLINFSYPVLDEKRHMIIYQKSTQLSSKGMNLSPTRPTVNQILHMIGAFHLVLQPFEGPQDDGSREKQAIEQTRWGHSLAVAHSLQRFHSIPFVSRNGSNSQRRHARLFLCQPAAQPARLRTD